MESSPDVDVVVIGGGPSGSVAACLLARMGHRVCLLTRQSDPARALANSLPPSTVKLLTRVGVLDLVERLGTPTYGNTVWWGRREGHANAFGSDADARGFQVDRATLDPALLARAREAGVRVADDVRVRDIHWGAAATVTYAVGREVHQVRARLLLDCSGRAGVVAVPAGLRRHVPGGRMQALVGVWTRDQWAIENASHTFIETWDQGWAWSLASDARSRHLGLMVDGASSRIAKGGSLEATYRAVLGAVPRLHAQLAGATLGRVFACDASVYDATAYADERFLLVGDAGATLNPLSSFGMKKALTSAWLAAIVANTSLRHVDRAPAARAFFSAWESQVFATNLARSREFASEAHARHPSAFWALQQSLPVDPSALPLDEEALLVAPDTRAALARLRASHNPVLVAGPLPTFVSAPIVRGDLIAIEPAVRLSSDPREAVRYVRGIDLVALAQAAHEAEAGEAFARYQARFGHTVPADLLGCLALLLARGILALRAA